MNLLGKIDAITSREYGFNVVPSMEMGKLEGNDLVGMVRIASDPLKANDPDEVMLAADIFACSVYFEGGIDVIDKNLRQLSVREIALFFSTIFEKYKPVVVNGHKHDLKNIVVRGPIGNQDPVHNDPLILIMGTCENKVPHNSQPELLRGLNFYEGRLGEFEKQGNNLKRLQIIAGNFNNFFAAANQDQKSKAEYKGRLQALNERMAKAVNAANKISEANQGDQHNAAMPMTKGKVRGVQKDEKLSRLNSELHAKLSKANAVQAEETSKIGNSDATQNADGGSRLAALEVQLNSLKSQSCSPAKLKEWMDELSSIMREKDAKKNATQIQSLFKKLTDLTERLQADK